MIRTISKNFIAGEKIKAGSFVYLGADSKVYNAKRKTLKDLGLYTLQHNAQLIEEFKKFKWKKGG